MAPAPTDPDRLVDRLMLTDRSHCPSCGSTLLRPRCPACGVDLSGQAGQRVWDLSVQAAQVLDARHAAVLELRRSTWTAAATAAPAVPRPAVAPPGRRPGAMPPDAQRPDLGPPGPRPEAFRPLSNLPLSNLPLSNLPLSNPPLPHPPRPGSVLAGSPHPSRSGLLHGVGMQVVLVGLGALLLAVSVVVFLVVSWDRLSLGWRAGIVGGLTLAALVVSWRLRSGLLATAEAVGALGVVMVLADAWAVRGMGLFGADQVDAYAYACVAVGGCALLLGGWAGACGVRAGSVAGALLAPASPMLGGIYAAHQGEGPGWLGSAALIAVLVTGVRLALPDRHGVERVVLRAWAVTGLGVAGSVCAVLTAGDGRSTATWLLVLACAVATVQARCDLLPAGSPPVPARVPSVGLRRLWSGVAGAALTAAALPSALGLVEAGHGDGSWVVALAPGLAGVSALVSVRLAPLLQRLGVRGRALVTASGVVVGALAVPVVLIAAWWMLLVVCAPWSPWRAGAGSALAQVLPTVRAGDPGLASGQAAMALGAAAVAVTAAAVSRVGGLTMARRLRSRLDRWAAAATVTGTVLGCLAPTVPLWAVIALLGGVALAGGVLLALAMPRNGAGPAPAPVRDRPPRLVVTAVQARAGGAAATVAGTLAVLVSWNVRTLSVPVTLAGIVALVLARRPAPAVLRPMLVGVAAVALAPAAGATVALAGRGTADRVTVAGIALGALAVPLAGIRSWPRWPFRPAGPVLSGPERLAVVAACLVGLAAALAVVTEGAGTGGPDPLRQAGLLAAAVVVAAAAVARRHGPFSTAGAGMAAAALPPLVAALGLALRAGDVLTVPGPVLLAGTASAAAVLVAGLVLGRGGHGSPAAAPAPQAPGSAPQASGSVSQASGSVSQASGPDPRRLPAEVAAAVVGVAALLTTGDADRLWVVLLLLGTGAGALSALPDRRRVGWAAGGLLTASSWIRLGLADVGVVEAYTLPPAAALLAVGALRLRRDRAAGPWRALGPGTAAALLPSLVASPVGGQLRPWLLLALAAAAVATGLAVPAVRELAVPGAAAAVAAAGVGAGRPVAALAEGLHGVVDVELWSVPAAAVLLGAGLLSAPASWPRRPLAEGPEPAPERMLPVAWAAVPALALVLGVTTLAAVDQTLFLGGDVLRLHEGPATAAWRCAAVLTAALVVAVAAAVRAVDGIRSVPLEIAALAPAAVAAGFGWAAAGWPVEVWAVPFGIAVAVTGAGQLHRHDAVRGGAVRAGIAGGALVTRVGAAVVFVPSVLAGVDGPPLRPALLLGVAVALTATAAVAAQRMPASLPQPVPQQPLPQPAPVPAGPPALPRELIRVGLAGAVAVAGAVGLLRSLAGVTHEDSGLLPVEGWSLPAAAVVAAAGLAAGRSAVTASWWCRVAPSALLLAWIPTAAAVAASLVRHGSGAGVVWTEPEQLLRAVRLGGVFALAGAVVAADAWSGSTARASQGSGQGQGWLQRTAAAGLAGACVAAGLGLGDRPREEWRWAVPLAALLLLTGAARLVRVPGTSSWPALAPGMAILFLPSLWIASTAGGTVRIVWLVGAGTAAVAAGAVLRLQAPLMLGATALAAHAVVQLGPWVVQLAGTVPRWVVLSLAGALLLALGSTYERRLKQVRDARLMIASLR